MFIEKAGIETRGRRITEKSVPLNLRDPHLAISPSKHVWLWICKCLGRLVLYTSLLFLCVDVCVSFSCLHFLCVLFLCAATFVSVCVCSSLLFVRMCVIALSMCAVVYVRMSMSAFLVCIHLSCSRVSPICFYVSDHFSFRVYFACVYCYLLSTSFVFK